MKDNLLKKQSEEDWVDSTLLAKNGAGGRNLMFASMERNIKKKKKRIIGHLVWPLKSQDLKRMPYAGGLVNGWAQECSSPCSAPPPTQVHSQTCFRFEDILLV